MGLFYFKPKIEFKFNKNYPPLFYTFDKVFLKISQATTWPKPPKTVPLKTKMYHLRTGPHDETAPEPPLNRL